MNPCFHIIDNFLDPTDWRYIQHYMENERFEFVHQRRWVKAFRLEDGEPLWGPVYLSDAYDESPQCPVYPTGDAMDLVISKVKEAAKKVPHLIGEQGKDWHYFFARAYLYPRGCGLSWHRDNQNNATGAYVYYAHPEWNPTWGGEFLVAPNTKSFVYPEKELYGGEKKFLGSHIDNTHEHEALFEEGVGSYILPKPNRLVFLTSGVIHCIKKVEDAAGNHLRQTIQGFFQDPGGLCEKNDRNVAKT